MSALRRIVRALGAALAIVAVLLGVPVALWWLAAPRLADVLGGSAIGMLLRPDDGSLLLAVLALVAVVAWLILTVSILGQLGAAAVRRPAPRIDLPGFRMGGAVAAALVAALLGASPALAAPGPGPAGPVPGSTASLVPEPAAPEPATPPTAGPEHVVLMRDTLWGIAENHLGDPLRWHEIYELNVGRLQADGGRLAEGGLLTPGWVLVLPADAAPTVIVHSGDTLSGLASEHLGDPDRADELFERNAGVPQPDGRTLTSPRKIRPGWTLTLPDPPPGTAASPTGSSGPAAGPSPSPPSAPVTEDPRPAAPPAAPTAGIPLTPTTTEPAPPPATTRPAVSSEPASTAPRPTTAESSGSSLVLPALGLTAVVATGVLAVLTVRRRRQQRHRPHGHRLAVPGDDSGRLEWTARQEIPSTELDRLDLALRSFVHPDVRPDPAPIIDVVERQRTTARIHLAAPARLPEPFTPADDAATWDLHLDAPLSIPEDEVTGYGSVFPTLVTIGVDGDRTLLIDLEHRRVLRVGGNTVRARALMRHIAAELATSAWAQDVETFVVGFGDEPEAFNPDRIVAEPDMGTAMGQLERRAVVTRMELSRLQLSSAVEGRLHDNAAGSWLPTVLIVGHETDDIEDERIDELMDDATAGTTGIAIVLLDPTRPDVRIHDDGRLDLVGPVTTGDGAWQAVQLTDGEGDHLAELLGTTDDPAVPAGPADGDEPWSEGMNEDGSLDTSDPDAEAPGHPVPDPRPGTPLPADEQEDPTPSRTVDPEALRRLAIVDHQDPNLDDDLAAWWATGTPSVPMIGILGEPVVRGTGPRPTTRPSWFAEVLVYLSLHPAGVTQATAATDLWPDGHRISPATIRHAFYGARRWAGRGFGGDPGATFVSDLQNDNSYRLRGHLLDWDLFRRLRKRAHARHAACHPGAVADYESALDLVRGPVLSALRPGGYAWLNNHDQRHDLQIPGFVVDTAHELVNIALDAGDPGLARRAAERARVVDIDVAFDRPLTDLMRIAHAEDNRAELELYGSILLDARGFDVPEELAPESFTVLNELLPSGPRRSRT